MINLTCDFTAANKRAIEIKPIVRRVDVREYRVAASRGGFYIVAFVVAFDGRFASCTCEHGARDFKSKSGAQSPCYHVAAAASLHKFWSAKSRELMQPSNVVSPFWSPDACPPPMPRPARRAAAAREDELILNLPPADDSEFLGMSKYNQSRFIC